EPLVLTVVPFLQVGLDHGVSAETRQLARLARSTERARQHEREGLIGENRTQTPGHRSPVLGEPDIGHTSVLPAQAPFGLSMADDVDSLRARCQDPRIRRSRESLL